MNKSKVTVIKITWYWLKYRYTAQWNGTLNLETDTQTQSIEFQLRSKPSK